MIITCNPRALLLGATMLLAASAPALAVEPFSADYQASYMGMQANGKMTLASAGANRWKYNLSIEGSVATLSQTTVFEEHDGNYRPLSGSDVSRC